ncbi:Zeatin O-xylosyltransferase [Forsythia ovata]|uniref:Zeatin O-xylosyltransferase n=1 Tax=Forsythia ovata TaxID=205694 RepID=A0ABD1WCL0_9LAMI
MNNFYRNIPDHGMHLQHPRFQEFIEFIEAEQKYLGFSSGSLYNASKVIEGKFNNLIKKIPEEENKKHWSIGPFNAVELTGLNQRHKCLEWLDKQEPKSVIFVSFGTTTSLTRKRDVINKKAG